MKKIERETPFNKRPDYFDISYVRTPASKIK